MNNIPSSTSISLFSLDEENTDKIKKITPIKQVYKDEEKESFEIYFKLQSNNIKIKSNYFEISEERYLLSINKTLKINHDSRHIVYRDYGPIPRIIFMISLTVLLVLGSLGFCQKCTSIFNLFQLVELIGFISLINLDFICLVLEVSGLILEIVGSINLPSSWTRLKISQSEMVNFPKFRYKLSYSFQVGMIIENSFLFCLILFLVSLLAVFSFLLKKLIGKFKIFAVLKKISKWLFKHSRIMYYNVYLIGIYDYIFFSLFELVSNLSISNNINDMTHFCLPKLSFLVSLIICF